MRFTKMQGLGNDYIYLDCTAETPPDLPALAVRLSDRHFGVGSDGLICVLPAQRADFGMRIFNADGSEGEMCGNGIRCLGKYVYDRGLTDREDLSVETLAGVKHLTLQVDNGKVSAATVDMGVPAVGERRELTAEGVTYTVTPVSMGNPHAVVFHPAPESVALDRVGPALERHSAFPDRTNVELVHILCPGLLQMRVWERGSGETLACGTGACAALAAASSAALTARRVTVRLPGGDLAVDWRGDGHIYLTGPAVTVFEGEIE